MEITLLYTFSGLGVFLLFLAGNRLLSFREQQKYRLIFVLWFLSIVYCVGCYFILICTNIEMIHFLQYAIMSYWLMSIYPDPRTCFILVSFLGCFDEFVNYLWHPRFTPYLDFNDMILNSTGALIGVAVYLTFSKPLAKGFTHKILTYCFILALIVNLVLIAGIIFGFVKIHYKQPTPPHSAFVNNSLVLSFKQPKSFWEVTKRGKRFHIMDPIEGIIALTLFLSLNSYLLLVDTG